MTHPVPTPDPAPPTRRNVLFDVVTWLTGGLAAVAFTVPVVSYLFAAIKRPKKSWVPLDDVKAFPEGATRWVTFENPLRQPWETLPGKTGVYVRYLGKKDGRPDYWVFAANCAHLGCPVTWFPESGLFMCPCHGGVYYENGDRASGPPPRGLYKCDWRVHNAKLEIQAPHLPTLQDPLIKEAKG